MLSHSLILLCIGAYASCMPTSQTLTGLDEIQDRLEIVRTQGKVTLRKETVEIPDILTKECANFNLDKFIKALDSLNVASPTEVASTYKAMLDSLKMFGKSLAHHLYHYQDCKTAAISTSKLLDEFDYFLKEVQGYLRKEARR